MSVAACICNIGSTGPNGGPCTLCLPDTYMLQTGNGGCQGCLANSGSPAGSTIVTACVCNAGWDGPDGGACVQCTSGSYKMRTGNTGCAGCPLNTLSPAGSTRVTACTCNAGWNGPNGDYEDVVHQWEQVMGWPYSWI
jgi:hypothetical protein